MQTQSYYRLEQLAHMGLPEQIFIPALLQELHHSVPSFANTFCWQDANGHLDNIYDESLNTVGIDHFITAISSSSSDKYSHTTKWVSNLNEITTTFDYYGKCPHVAEFYKTILLPMDYYNSCFVPIILPKNNSRHGILMLHRQKGSNRFSIDERKYLSRISDIIQAYHQQAINNDIYTIDGWVQGMLLVDSNGMLQHGCTMGLKLLALASSAKFNQYTHATTDDLNCFLGLKELISSITTSKNNLHDVADPTLSLSNPWGEFKLRAFLTNDLNGQRSSRVSFIISWQEPFVLKLFHRIKTLNLTPRQETVGLFYAAGDQLQAIADKLKISLHTVKEHIRNISDRLHIKTRADLIAFILCDKAFSH